AGGLNAAADFLEHMPENSGMAFVLVFHLDPAHKSETAELLQTHTKMPVAQIEGRTPIRPDHVYVIPPGHGLSLVDGALELSELVRADGRPTVIDRFFRSLATEAGERAIGIVLSGTGTEGSQGLKSIKEAGGISVVQDEAEYGGMPRSAIATGLIDLVLPVGAMGKKLLEIKGSAFQGALPGTEAAREDDTGTLQKILVQLRTRTGHDFSHYKQSTVLRRVAHRMQMQQFGSLEAYLEALRSDPAETTALFRELLISVTNFFRDPEAFATLAKLVIPQICEKREEGATVRIWVPGCATGEEAYSLAMLLREACDELAQPPKLQIFATDVDERALDTARRGLFPDAIAGDVSEARLKRFFTRNGSNFEVAENLREMILFARHDILRDPPFSKLDLISCRNLLIYLTTEMQAEVFQLFHFVLNPSGQLFLGSSESLGKARKLFGERDRKAKIFQKKQVASPELQFPLLPDAGSAASRRRADMGAGQRPAASLQRRVQQELLARYAPPCVVVDENHDVTYISGRVGKYLEPSAGAPSHNVLDMAREGLRIELRTALYRTQRSGEATNARQVRVQTDGKAELIGLTVQPLTGAENQLLVLFEDLESDEAQGPPNEGESDMAIQLERELRETQESLQTTIEEMETSNEELQSTSEELETGKDELQSANEELHTVNQELQSKNDELARTNDDLKNFSANTEIGTLFLDEELRVRRYTPRLTELFNLIAGDVGRPLTHLTHNLETDDLAADATRVLRDLVVVEKELGSKNGRFYQTRLRPYRTVENKIAGVVLTFVDISKRHRLEAETQALNVQLEAQKAYAESIIATVREPLLVLNADLRVVSASRAFYRAFQTTPRDTEGELLYELGKKRWNIPELRHLLEEVLPRDRELDDFEVNLEVAGLGKRNMLLNARPLQQKTGLEPLILLAIEDATERTQSRAEEHRKLLVNELNHRMKNTLSTVQSIATQTLGGSPANAEQVWVFESRLMALAKAHALLSRGDWESATLHDLLAQELAPFSGGERDRLVITGRNTELRSKVALALGMAFHELATNAVKYGALSRPGGKIRIASELLGTNRDRLRLSWTETGGPEVKEPERRGFGSRLVEGGLAHELNGKVHIAYEPRGIVCTMEIPLTRENDLDADS
ncbi:MAG: CheR family methyltransferase, partial [Gammaproteobacteria bacterium]